jgi:light-regulated signal transduction histidine kinase (bacteriophytochrome)
MDVQKVRILLVEDSPTDAKLVQLDLSQAEGYHSIVEHVCRLDEALAKLHERQFDVALLDLGLPDSTGFATFKRIKAESSRLPIVVLTSVEDEALGIEAIRGGAQDYLTKGSIDGKTIARSIRHAVERKSMEEQLRVKIAELAFANKELEAFSFSVSHDLRSPLQGIITLTEMLKTEYGEQLGSEGIEMISHILGSAHRMSAITLDLLSLSKIALAEIKREPIDMSALARSVSTELQNNSPERNVEISIEPGLTARADKGLARILLENLMGNAWKFTCKKDRAHIEFGAQKNCNQRTFFIKDDGAGFNMSDADKLFKPFHRLHGDKEFKGTGIGLSIVKRIIDKHCGAVHAEAVVDKGAMFYFRFE